MSMRASMHASRSGSIAASCGFFAGGETHTACLGRRQSMAARPLGSLRRAGSVLSTDNGLPSTPPNGATRPDGQMVLNTSMSEPFFRGGTGLPVATDNSLRPTGPGNSRPKTRKLFIEDGVQKPAEVPTPCRPGTPAENQPGPDCRPCTPVRPNTPSDEPCGLTPASLKHLRRQRDGLSEDKERLLAEVARLNALLRDQRDRVIELETAEAANPAAVSVPEPSERDTSSRESDEKSQKEEAWLSEEAKLRAQIAKLMEERSLLDDSLSRREIEIARLRNSLHEQLEETKEQREGKDRAADAEDRARQAAADMAARMARLEAELLRLNSQNGELEGQKSELASQVLKTEQKCSESEAKVDSVTKMHEDYKDQTEKLRTGLVGTAIQSKLELHISVPHVVLTYNNAPPLTVSTAVGLSKAKIIKFLENMLFPHFEPLWVCLDGVDRAPDGTNKKKYSSRMLERLTDSIKDFIEKSQIGEAGCGDLGGGPPNDSSSVREAPRKRSNSSGSLRPSSQGGDGRGFKGLGSLRTSAGPCPP